ncbi:hypothetical protein SAMN05660874_05661 [Saccharopolyspora flava]|uniref:DUF6292 domain-containing protein n=2 Tax=Saccharopolyspora flava TaxID=95161 RepID=A0A1I6V6V1_9PSEU|nr:hypothetical protein SAMN05660874_05661 [Saccharopolyspora flava]
MADEVDEVDVDVDGGLATVIVLVKSRVPTLADSPLLLTWDEVAGWALRVETSSMGHTTPLAYLGEDILPDPQTVQAFLRDAVHGRNPGTLTATAFRLPNAGDDLETRLAQFLDHERG